MLHETEINTTIEPLENEEDSIVGRWESQDEADGTVFEDEEQSQAESA